MHLLKRKMEQGDVYVDATFFQLSRSTHKRVTGKLQSMRIPVAVLQDKIPRYQLQVKVGSVPEYHFPAIDAFDKRYTIKNVDGKTTLVDR